MNALARTAASTAEDAQRRTGAVSTEFGYTEDESNSILNFFSDGQRNAAGMMNAITAAVQQFDDADRAYKVEATAISAMALAARFPQRHEQFGCRGSKSVTSFADPGIPALHRNNNAYIVGH